MLITPQVLAVESQYSWTMCVESDIVICRAVAGGNLPIHYFKHLPYTYRPRSRYVTQHLSKHKILLQIKYIKIYYNRHSKFHNLYINREHSPWI